MEVPNGLNVDGHTNKRTNVEYRLNESLYGLKQALRSWKIKFCNFLNKRVHITCAESTF